MSTGPFQRVATVSAPIKGSFPLDHEQSCKLEMLKYMVCLKEHKNRNEDCRTRAKDYFQCRMDSGLMDRDAWPRLGFKEIEGEIKQVDKK
uniref:CHCH domain-containing protein n=1 Tax=Panagrellus redivivus TaxID=6233 RepID=A0A7E4W8C1_PANRE